MEDNRLNDVIVEEVITEDEMVDERFNLRDGAIAGGIAIAGIVIFEGGKWIWKKTSGPRHKLASSVKKILPKKAPTKGESDSTGSEVTTEAAEAADKKKSDKKANKK